MRWPDAATLKVHSQLSVAELGAAKITKATAVTTKLQRINTAQCVDMLH